MVPLIDKHKPTIHMFHELGIMCLNVLATMKCGTETIPLN